MTPLKACPPPRFVWYAFSGFGEQSRSRKSTSQSLLNAVGTVTVHEDGTYDFLPDENFADAFVVDVNLGETALCRGIRA